MANHGMTTDTGSDDDLLGNPENIFEFNALPSDGTLDAVHVWCETNFGGNWRWAIYKGGSADDPNGATVVFDGGEWAGTTGTWGEVTAGGETLLATDRLWIAYKRNDNNMWTRSFVGAEGDYVGNGRNNFGEGDDETVAFSTIAASGTDSVNVDSVAAYIEYTPAGGGPLIYAFAVG